MYQLTIASLQKCLKSKKGKYYFVHTCMHSKAARVS